MTWLSIADLLDQLDPPLSESELSHVSRLATAINHALHVAGEMPTTFDARSRALIVTKLQEAEHWSIELLRVAARPRSSPTQ